MVIPTTSWSPQPTDARTVDGDLFMPWSEGDDRPVAINLSPQLDIGETPTSVSVKLWRLKADGEADHTEMPASVIGSPVISGTEVRQRIKDLVRGRIYRCRFYHGAAGNVRSSPVVLWVGDS